MRFWSTYWRKPYRPTQILKTTFLIVATAFCFSVTSAQSYSGIMNIKTEGDWSLEANTGLIMPFSPSNDVSFGKAFDVGLGLRYLPEYSSFGVRGLYDYSSFKEDTEINGEMVEGGLHMHRFELQGIYLLNDLLNFSQFSPVELESYLGIGGILGKSKIKSATNKIGTVSIGLRPRFELANHIKWFLDLAYRMQFRQQYNYAGVSYAGKNFGSLLQLGIGISYNLY